MNQRPITPRDREMLYQILFDFGRLLAHLDEVRAEIDTGSHEKCDGCVLCGDAPSLIYTLEIYESMMESEAPYDVMERLRKQCEGRYLRECDDDDDDDDRGDFPPDDAPPVPDVPALVLSGGPSRGSKPYWLQ